MGLFDFFKKNTKLEIPVDLSILGSDIHSHFIPGIDDGAKTIEESVVLITEMYNMWYKKVIT